MAEARGHGAAWPLVTTYCVRRDCAWVRHRGVLPHPRVDQTVAGFLTGVA